MGGNGEYLKSQLIPIVVMSATTNRGAQRRSASAAIVAGLTFLVIGQGCVSKSKANAQAHQAFLAGQQQAMMASAPQPNSNMVMIVGPVQMPSIQWTADLTLAKAIVNAGYQSPKDPKQIMIVRNGQAVPVNPKSLLAGEDVPLMAGDMIVLRE